MTEQKEPVVPAINARTKSLFIDRDEAGIAQRSFTFDEATLVGVFVEALAQRNMAALGSFSVGDVLRSLSRGPANLATPGRYIRSALEFLQGQVNVGLLTEVTPSPVIGGMTHDQRQFAAGSTLALDEWARGSAAATLGLPYAAHVFSDVAVRVHRGGGPDSPIASGVVIAEDWVITNAHAVNGATDVHVSWGKSPLVKAAQVIPSVKLDLAAVHVPGFQAYPTVWFRRPRPAEPIVILAYPEVPQIVERPLLKFSGCVATDEPLTTYFGDQQIVVSAVMGPGASGGPIFGADGSLVAIVVQTLEGKHLAEDGHTMQSTFHTALPADLVLEEVRALDPRLSLVNKWA